MNKRPEFFQYGIISEEVIEWYAKDLLEKIGECRDDAAREKLVRVSLWQVTLESSHTYRGGEKGVPFKEDLRLLQTRIDSAEQLSS